MKTYKGKAEGRAVTVDNGAEEGLNLAMRQDIRNHSPDGANWGYCGSGPAQLALALTHDAVIEEGYEMKARYHYQSFKEAVIAEIPSEFDWEMDEDFVRKAVKACEDEHAEELRMYVKYRVETARKTSGLHGSSERSIVRFVGLETPEFVAKVK